MSETMRPEDVPKFGEPFPVLPMSDFHAINAATINHAATTNDDLMRLIQLRPSWETLAPSSVTPHLLRRILSDDTVIQGLREKLSEAEADRHQARAELETLRAEIGETPDAEWAVQTRGAGTTTWPTTTEANARRHIANIAAQGRRAWLMTRLVGEWREAEEGGTP